MPAAPAPTAPARAGGRGPLTTELYRLLGLLDDEQTLVTALPPEEELALAQMLQGFHNLLRYWHRCLAALAPRDPHDPLEPLSRPGRTSAPAAPSASAAGADEGGGLGRHGCGAKNG